MKKEEFLNLFYLTCAWYLKENENKTNFQKKFGLEKYRKLRMMNEV